MKIQEIILLKFLWIIVSMRGIWKTLLLKERLKRDMIEVYKKLNKIFNTDFI
jgi:hypothetical protein